MEFLVPLGLMVMAGALTLQGLSQLSPWLPRRVVRWTARRLRDEEAIERYSEEWEAELDSIPSSHSQVWFAFGRVLSLSLMLREQRMVRVTRDGFSGRKRSGGFSADEFLEVTEQYWGRLKAYGIDHFVVIDHGEHILVRLTDGRVETVMEPKALEALLIDLRNYALRNGLEQSQAER
ncbi:hypothetical protein [Glycomyces tritici]|uniref:YbjN domain-containing protein n=1 Tax=Glycomyces tritici TaxID=2665176 RepID=A0ABT7YKT8_9ACTN|nr:hypothetical protein [Glycomyces tritici]MDN3239221.1 hypothetical protein [Glycomyces tritici]